MNKEAFEKDGKSFKTMWNAKLILKDIKRTKKNKIPLLLVVLTPTYTTFGHCLEDEKHLLELKNRAPLIKVLCLFLK